MSCELFLYACVTHNYLHKIKNFVYIYVYVYKRGIFKIFPESMRNTKEYNNLSKVSLEIVPLCKLTLLPATINVLQTFLKSILLELFLALPSHSK
jgi:poly(A) polymerase Pap1